MVQKSCVGFLVLTRLISAIEKWERERCDLDNIVRAKRIQDGSPDKRNDQWVKEYKMNLQLKVLEACRLQLHALFGSNEVLDSF